MGPAINIPPLIILFLGACFLALLIAVRNAERNTKQEDEERKRREARAKLTPVAEQVPADGMRVAQCSVNEPSGPAPTQIPPRDDPADLAKSVLRLAEQLGALAESGGATEAEKSEFRAEGQDSVLALICAVVMADGVLHPGETEYWTH